MRVPVIMFASLAALAATACSAPSDMADAQDDATARVGVTPIQSDDSYYRSAASAVDARI